MRPLFDHQENAIKLILECEENDVLRATPYLTFRTTCGVLSNPIGSGKTLTALTLLNRHPISLESRNKVVFNTGTIYEIDKTYFHTDIRQRKALSSMIPTCFYFDYSLVICTKPLINEWINEAQLSDIPVYTFSAPGDVRNISNGLPPKGSILICHPELMFSMIDAMHCKEYKIASPNYYCYVFNRVVFDDIHMNRGTFKGCSGKSVLGLFTWFLSATPGALDNGSTITKLKLISNALSPHSYNISRQCHVVTTPVTSYQEPPVNTTRITISQHTLSKVMDGILTQEVKNMLDYGDFTGVRNHFSEILGAGENVQKPIHELVLDVEIRKLHDLEKRRERYIQALYDTESISRKITEQQSKINGIRERLNVVMQEEAECPICMCDVQRNKMMITPCCNNMMCTDCINQIYGRTPMKKPCPVCRTQIKKAEMFIIGETGEAISIQNIAERIMNDTRSQNNFKTVFEAIEHVVMKDISKKYLIFTQSEDTIKTYKSFLEKIPRVKIASLSGRLTSMKKNIDSVKEGICNILFLNSRSMDAGLNLQFIDEIVLVGDCNRDRESQAIGRVRRYPRREPVNVTYISV
jgi:hypothetical protein